jgi:alpha-L-fucosidase
VRWVGNERGNAGETCWSTINTKGMAPGKADAKYLNTGDPHGKKWIPAETDVSIRPGWFWHEKENEKVRTPQNLVNLYYQSVGRNSLLLLNIPPNSEGLLSAADVSSIKAFRQILDETFKVNFAKDKVAPKLTDKRLSTFIDLKEKQSLTINLKQQFKIDRALLQENITKGQRAEEVLLEYYDGKEWKVIQAFTTIGYKRLLRFNEVETSRLRITILKCKAAVQLAELGFFKASKNE